MSSGTDTSVRMPVERYLRTSYHPDRDYVCGHLEKRNVGEWDHASLQAALIRYLTENAARFRVVTVPEIRVQVSPEEYRVADVCCVRRRPKGRIVTEPPVLVIEILSREDTVRKTEARVEDYLNIGVRWVWLIDPRRPGRAWIYENGQPRRDVRDGVLTAGDITVRLDDLPVQEDFEDEISSTSLPLNTCRSSSVSRFGTGSHRQGWTTFQPALWAFLHRR